MEEFILRVLRATAFEHCDDLWWRTDNEYAPVTFFVNCNDLFFWASADLEKVTKDNIADLEQAYIDADLADPELGTVYASLLFCARMRKMRPQKPYYKSLPVLLHPLFNACGPER